MTPEAALATSLYETLVVSAALGEALPSDERLRELATFSLRATAILFEENNRPHRERAKEAAEKQRERHLLKNAPEKLPRDVEGNFILKHHR